MILTEIGTKMQFKTVHPFPARMAPDLALLSLQDLAPGSAILDPMAGSGTVLRQALSLGHDATGFDMDPLAVLMAKVWTTPVADDAIEDELQTVLNLAATATSLPLPWQQDEETQAFIRFWFFEQQRCDLERLSWALWHRQQADLTASQAAAIDVLRIALSRIIVTKEQCASLARDTSHSRPHKVSETSQYDVMLGYRRSVEQLRKRLSQTLPPRAAQVSHGDARSLTLADNSIDAVITSPPYLNAIDYMRGHKMSLVWLGYTIAQLRNIRSTTIGTERARDADGRMIDVGAVTMAMFSSDEMAPRSHRMIERYASDLIDAVGEVARVLKPGGRATYVVGNSCLKGIFIQNAQGVAKAGSIAGLKIANLHERELPANRRYLPVTAAGALSRRMRTETVLTFEKPVPSMTLNPQSDHFEQCGS
ncbi:hypothetical protein [Rhizobium laguerreae]|uniref:hypothetical protein n=1 Tax=Rhizobium laguerreae TaxID=1076926 RepID=UPI0031BA4E1C